MILNKIRWKCVPRIAIGITVTLLLLGIAGGPAGAWVTKIAITGGSSNFYGDNITVTWQSSVPVTYINITSTGTTYGGANDSNFMFNNLTFNNTAPRLINGVPVGGVGFDPFTFTYTFSNWTVNTSAQAWNVTISEDNDHSTLAPSQMANKSFLMNSYNVSFQGSNINNRSAALTNDVSIGNSTLAGGTVQVKVITTGLGSAANRDGMPFVISLPEGGNTVSTATNIPGTGNYTFIITTSTSGVGVNRNITLADASFNWTSAELANLTGYESPANLQFNVSKVNLQAFDVAGGSSPKNITAVNITSLLGNGVIVGANPAYGVNITLTNSITDPSIISFNYTTPGFVNNSIVNVTFEAGNGNSAWGNFTNPINTSGPISVTTATSGTINAKTNRTGTTSWASDYTIHPAINGSVHNVNKGTNYTTIQAAINDASPGDEIHVDSGIYYENVIVNKQLTLRGIGRPVVDATGSGSAITLAADGITIEGFTATRGGSNYGDSGIKVTSNNNMLSGNNGTSNHFQGIFLSYSSNNTLSGNNATSNTQYGIFLSYSNGNTLSENNALNNAFGIYLYHSSNNKLNKNNASNNNIGISLDYSINNMLNGNNALNNAYGITMWDSSNNKIYNNIFNNTNNFYLSGTNINTWNTTLESSPNIIGGSYLGGNFWANPAGIGFSQTCPDADKDGICDTVYNLDGNNTDYLPLSNKALSASGPVHNINKGTNYTTIQAAINDASPGDEIHVDSGTYYENVYVNKKLTLRGIGMPVVDARESGSAITLVVNGIRLEGFTATRSGNYPEAGLQVTSSSNTLIANNASSNTGIGIILSSSSNNTLMGNNASNNHALNNSYNGIYLVYSSNNTLSDNNASNNGNGISLYYSSYNTLSGNIASNNGVGIYLDSSGNNTLSSNNVNSNNLLGILLYSSSNNKIYNNIFNNTNNVQFVGSNINTWNTTLQPSPNIIGGSHLGGNFWAKPDGTGFSQKCDDGNGDGICDFAYALDSNNIDFLPLVYKTEITPPSVTNPSASHEIPADTDNEPLWGETSQLNVTVNDENDIASVTINLLEIGGIAEKAMINIGGNIYSTTTNASAGTPPGLYNLTVNATDTNGNSNTSVRIQLRVMKNGDCTGNDVVNIGDALRLANNVSHPGNPAYALSSIYVCDVTGNGIVNIGDALRLANNVSHPGNLAYILK